MSNPRAEAIDSAVTRTVITGAARRQRALRGRRALGRVVLLVEVDEVAVTERLMAVGRLAPRNADDRGCVQAALAKLIEDWEGGALRVTPAAGGDW